MLRIFGLGAPKWTQGSPHRDKPATRFEAPRSKVPVSYYRVYRMRTTTLFATACLAIVATLVLLAHRRSEESFIPKQPLDWSDRNDDSLRFPPSSSGWQFDYRRDGRNYGLSEDQCNAAFPDLFKEVDRAVQHRRDKWGKITPDEVEVEWRGDGIVRAMVHDNQLYVIDPHAVWDHNHRPRTLSTLHAINRAINAYPDGLPNIEFSFTVHDFALHDRYGNHTTWAYTRMAHQEKLWLMPDFGMWAWPDVGLRSYEELQTVLELDEDNFVDKIPKIVWRGSLAVGAQDVRNGLVDHSKDQRWSDVLPLDWSNSTNIEERLLTMQDHCSYMFMAQTEGNTYSGRLKYLLNCHSVLLSHQLEWIELYHHLLKDSGPDQNYVRVARDYGDLRKKMDKLTKPENILNAKTIADNAKRTFRRRYLTPAAESCYWRALIRGWGSMMAFEPEFWNEVKEFDKVTQREKVKRKPRGVPFASYAIMEEVEWQIPAKPRKMCLYDVE